MQNSNSVQSYEFYEETRKYPRIGIKLPVQLYNEGIEYNANIFDVSPDGLQIRCSRETAAAINPQGKKIQHDDNIIVKAVFSLPINDELKEVRVLCRAYYFVLVDADKGEDVAFGLQFKQFEGDTVKYIGRHILSELEPNLS
jgi:hypothetical protein